LESAAGHLGVQFANKLGFRTVAIARGADKEALARKLGAHHFIDSATEDVVALLNHLGGARAVLATVASAEAMTRRSTGLRCAAGSSWWVLTPSRSRSCRCN
jgi:alcohol dehydrogenase